MENASKALLMAATILISVMLVSLATYLFATFGNYSKNINDNINQKTKQEFNAQFTKYENSECTVYDIVTIINLAKNCNDQYEEYQGINRPESYDNQNNVYIFVTIHGIEVNEKSNTTKLNNFISQHNTTTDGEYIDKYNCTVNISNQTGLVKSITFTQKN
mgnify:CR=1 FL=1